MEGNALYINALITKNMDKLRNAYHIIIAFGFMYWFSNVNELSQWNYPILSAFLWCGSLGFIAGVFWEYLMKYLFKSKVSKLDIVLTTGASFLAGLTSVWFPDVQLLQTIGLILTGVIIIAEIIKIVIIKKQK